MKLPILDLTDRPDDVLKEHVHTLAMTAADPLASSLTPKFQGLVADWKVIDHERTDLFIAVVTAEAKAVYIDSRLDEIADELVAALDKLTEKDRTAPIWGVFFKGRDPWDFKRPVLGGQLTIMVLWPEALIKAGNPELLAIEAKLSPLLPVATEAESNLRVARQKLVEHMTIGAYRAHIDKSNAERAAAYAVLLEIPHKNPAERLPAAYADLFFLHDTSRRGQVKKPKTAAEIGAEISALLGQVEALTESQKEAQGRETAEAAKNAERAKKAEELAMAEQQEKEAKAKKKALKKELGKKKK